MKLTNKHNLPKTLLNAIERDPYSMGDARISMTGLLRPPRIALLTKRHGNDIESDVSDHIWSLFGRAVHKILESGADEEHIPEERLFTEVRGWRISGQLDVQKLPANGIKKRAKIIDYKVCKAYSVMNEKVEWEQQLNSYGWLLRTAADYEVEGLEICAFVRDWDRNRAAADHDYPQSPAVTIAIPMWPHEAATKFVAERVRLHQEAIGSFEMGDEPPDCTDAERWMRPPRWHVMRKGNRRPSKVFDTPGEADQFQKERGADYSVVHRPGEPIRCTGNYCQVAPWCSQYARWVSGKK